MSENIPSLPLQYAILKIKLFFKLKPISGPKVCHHTLSSGKTVFGLQFFTDENKFELVTSGYDRNIFPLCYYKKLEFHLVNSSQMKLAHAC